LYVALQGIEVLERVPIPKELIPADAHVEIDAKVGVLCCRQRCPSSSRAQCPLRAQVFQGYEGGNVYKVTAEELKQAKGRSYGEKGDPLKPGFIAASE
jgi:hypothetical protein